MDFEIRAASAHDALAVGKLIVEFQQYLRNLGDPTDARFGAAAFLADGFGDSPAFDGLVAEASGEIVGYLLYHFGYDTDLAERLIYMIDLYVQETWRQHGVGRALVRSALSKGRTHGAKAMIWSVYRPNTLATAFYERLGATKIVDLDFMQLRIAKDDDADGLD